VGDEVGGMVGDEVGGSNSLHSTILSSPSSHSSLNIYSEVLGNIDTNKWEKPNESRTGNKC